MTYAQKYIEKVREALRARGMRDSDNQVAKSLGVSRASIHQWKTGHCGMDIRDGYRVAIFLELDPIDVVADLQMDQAKSEELRDFFSRVRELKEAV